MSDLKVGDVCIVVGLPDPPPNPPYGNGYEVTIEEIHPNWKGSGETRYQVGHKFIRAENSVECFMALRVNLRRKDEPGVKREETGDWDLLPWNPYRVKEKV